jgi:hypothetical protein
VGTSSTDRSHAGLGRTRRSTSAPTTHTRERPARGRRSSRWATCWRRRRRSHRPRWAHRRARPRHGPRR